MLLTTASPRPDPPSGLMVDQVHRTSYKQINASYNAWHAQPSKPGVEQNDAQIVGGKQQR